MHSCDTKLKYIPAHMLWVECHCGHKSGLRVSDLLKATKAETVDDVMRALRCDSCGAARVADYRITYPGGSDQALKGAEQGGPGSR